MVAARVICLLELQAYDIELFFSLYMVMAERAICFRNDNDNLLTGWLYNACIRNVGWLYCMW